MKQVTADIYERVTSQIIQSIEAGLASPGFRMPWHVAPSDSPMPVNAASRRLYRGINVLALWIVALAKEYPTNVWGTYKQWQELGAQVREGEKSALVVFWKVSERDGKDRQGIATGPEDEGREQGRGLIARGYSVFNAAQVDGYTPPEAPRLAEAERIDAADRFFAALSPSIRYGGTAAFYDVVGDFIQVPDFSRFRDATGFYATLAHEMTHWSGAKHRLDRDLSGRFGSESYAMEELVAELGAAFVCASLGLSTEPRPDHAAYVGTWLRVLKADKKAIFTAASKAQGAVDWMHARQEGAEEHDEALAGNAA